MTDRVEEARTRLECSGCGLHSISGVSDLIAAVRAESAADTAKAVKLAVEAVRKEMHTHGPWSALIRIHEIATGGAWDPEQYTDFRASDAIAAVEGLRAEQPARMIRCKCGHETWTEQPAAVSHVANCSCHRHHSEQECVKWNKDRATNEPHNDPRCKPGLLREAEVRLSAIVSVNNQSEGDVDFAAHKARAEVERLRK